MTFGLTPEERQRMTELTERALELRATLSRLRESSVSQENLSAGAPGSDAETLWTYDRMMRRFTFVNPRVEKMFGMRVGQALMAGPDQTSNPPSYRKFVEKIDRIYQSTTNASTPRPALPDEDMQVIVRPTSASGDSSTAVYVIVSQRLNEEGLSVEVSGILCTGPVSAGSKAVQSALDAWSSLFMSLPLPTLILGVDMRVRNVNKIMMQELGVHTAFDCIGKQCYKLVHGMDAPHPDCPLMMAMERNVDARAAIDEPHLGASYLFHTAPIDTDSGVPNGCICVACNISAFRESHRVLAESLMRLSLAQTAGKFGVWHIPLTKDVKLDDLSPVRFTREFYDLLGIDNLTETSFRPVMSYWQRIMSSGNYKQFLGEIKKLIAGETDKISFKFSRNMHFGHGYSKNDPAENTMMYCVRASCRYSSEGYPIQVVGTLTDVSGSEKGRLQLEELHRLLEVAYESVEGGTCSVNVIPGRPLMLNDPMTFSPGVCRLFAIPEDVHGTVGSFVSRLVPDDAQMLLADLIDLALGSLPHCSAECSATDLAGESLKFQLNAERKESDANGAVRIECLIKKIDT